MCLGVVPKTKDRSRLVFPLFVDGLSSAAARMQVICGRVIMIMVSILHRFSSFFGACRELFGRLFAALAPLDPPGGTILGQDLIFDVFWGAPE